MCACVYSSARTQECEREPTPALREQLEEAQKEFDNTVSEVEKELASEESVNDSYTFFCSARLYAFALSLSSMFALL
jgi:hypothetical protein